jgi:hypothetical protein
MPRDAHLCLLGRRQRDEPHDTAVFSATDDGKLTEVLVESDEHPQFAVGASEDFLVAGIL